MERAAELFAERGIAATTVDEVLAAAGAGKGQFYHYFRGRDELAAAAWIDPSLITKQETLYIDADTTHGPSYGETMSWTEENKPKLHVTPTLVWVDLDRERFERMFVELMTGTATK